MSVLARVRDRLTGLLDWLRITLKDRMGRAPLTGAAMLIVGGILFWGAFNTAMEATNTLPFCISCHEMRSTVYQEYRHSVHHTNASGVQAVCADCHVPKEWTAKFVRKIKASQELLYWALGTIDTPEKFEKRRPVLAERVWSAMKASNSQECRNCHNFADMDRGGQGRFAARMHEEAISGAKTCIDCHRGIAHKLPQQSRPVTAAKPAFDEDLANEINMTCAPCHGRMGQGTPDGHYPRLAGLDPAYLTRQLEQFKAKTRVNIPMLPYATERELPEGDIKTIVAYLSSIQLPTRLGTASTEGFDALARLKETKEVLNIPLYPGQTDAGRRLYAKECASCHGRDGNGDTTRHIPQLAGQHSLYLKRQITSFQKGERVHDVPRDAAVFAAFSETEIDNILAYLSTLDDT